MWESLNLHAVLFGSVVTEPFVDAAGDTVCYWSAQIQLTGGSDSTYATFNSMSAEFRDSLSERVADGTFTEIEFVDVFGSNRIRSGYPLSTENRGPIEKYSSVQMTLRMELRDGELQSTVATFDCQRADIERLGP